MLSYKRIIAISLVLTLIISIGLIGCAKKKGKEPYKIGAVFAITGKASFLGEPERNTVKIIEEEINAAGGINGHLLEVIVEDTTGDPTKTVNAVNRLISKDVLAVVGPSRSGSTMAIVDIVDKAKVPLISCAAAETIVTDPKTGKERNWVFKTPQKDSHAAIRIYEHMQRQNISKVAIITGTTGFGAQGRKQLLNHADKMSITIVADETYAPADTDMTAQLTKIKETDAQAVVNWSIVDGQSIVPKNMGQLKMTIPLYQSHGFGNVKYIDAAGKDAEGIIFPAGRLLIAESLPDSNPQKDLLVKYKTAYEKKYAENVSTFGGHAYDAIKLVIKALEEVGPEAEDDDVNVLRSKIRDAIEKTANFAGTGGIFNFSPDDHNGLTKDAFEMQTVTDGKFAPLPK